MLTKTLYRASLAAAGVALGLILLQNADAADHTDSPATQADLAADIADFYAWHIGDRIVPARGEDAGRDAQFTNPGAILGECHVRTARHDKHRKGAQR